MALAAVLTWLGGARRDAPPDAPSSAGPPGGPAPPVMAPLPVWPRQRLEITDSLWGEGCPLPGLADEALRLAAPLGVSAATSLLLVGAGGGAALRLASDLGAWVCACDADPTLSAEALRMAQLAGGAVAKRIEVQRYDPARPAFRRAAFHHALAIESLHLSSPDATLAAIAQALRPGGQLAVMQTVAGQGTASAALLAWCRLERRATPQAGTGWITGPLERLGFDIRVTEDISARQMRAAVAGWKRLVREMRGERPSAARAAVLVAEAELWLRRVALLRSGHIRVMRWHAIGPGVASGGG